MPSSIKVSLFSKGNAAQRLPAGFVRHLLALFLPYFTKILVNTPSIHSIFTPPDEEISGTSDAQSLCGIAYAVF